MPVDYHIHTKRCGHAEGEMAEYVAAAKSKGLLEMGFADHIPMYFLPEEAKDPAIAMPAEQLPDYAAGVREVQEKSYPYPVKFGIEADFAPGMEGELAAILKGYEFDYVLGSIHFLKDWGFDNPLYIGEYANWNILDLYRLYFNTLGQAAESRLFDSLAHPDLIKKFGYRVEEDEQLRRLYEETVQKIAGAGVCVEVNTAGLRVPAKEIYPHIDFLRTCYRHGVPVTLGSDAHSPQFVGAGFDQAIKLIREVGYSQVVTFNGRKKHFHRIW